MGAPAPLRIACIGAGYFSQFHLDGWARCAEADLVGVCDHEAARAAATGLPPFTNLAEMLHQTRPDVLDIILPPQGHASAIRTALAAGVKWIVCQKPFCAGQNEAPTLVAEAAAAGATLIVHENFRFQPWYRTIKSALERGAIGTLHQITFRLRPGDGQGAQAYLARQPYFQTMKRFLVHETAVHWIDVFRYLLGDPIAVYADLRQLNPAIAGEDAGHILFSHPGGVRALFDGNRHLDHAAGNLRCTMGEALVEGTSGTITLAGDGAVHLRRFGATDTRLLAAAHDGQGFGGDCVHALQAHVVSGILHGTPLENRARDYLTVQQIEAAIYLAAETGQRQPISPL